MKSAEYKEQNYQFKTKDYQSYQSGIETGLVPVFYLNLII